MKDVKILGPGRKRCAATAEMAKSAADRLGVPVHIEKVTDYAAIAGPKPEDAATWLAGA